MEMLVYIILAIFSSFVIMKACDGFEAAADYLGRNMKEGMKGATFNAIGSSIPELAVTAIYLFLFHDKSGFAGGIGTTAGSAVFNAMVIPALVILYVVMFTSIRKIEVSKIVILRDGLVLLAAEAILIFLLGDTLAWYHGAILMGIYISYALFMVLRHNKQEIEEDDDDDEDENESLSLTDRLLSIFKLDLETFVIGNNVIKTKNAILLLLASTTVVALASWLLVFVSEHIAISLGIHGYFVAVIIVAAASSIPDTILSMKDAKKGQYDDAISNALGSNIFDICFALGLPLFVYTLINGAITIPAETVTHIGELRVLLFILTFATFLILLFSKYLNKITTILLISFYSMFVVYIIGRAYELSFILPVEKFIQSIVNLIG